VNIAEVIIVGGGISGLYVAFRLREAHIPYLLLEAKSTFGGRIAGQPTGTDSDLSVDLGPTWFWAHQARIRQLLKHLDTEWFEQYSQGDALYHMHPEEAPSRTPGSAGTMTSYRVKGGMQKLIAALTDQLDQTCIRTRHGATTIKKHNNIWQVTAVNHGAEKTFAANQLVLALPPRLIVKYLEPERITSHSGGKRGYRAKPSAGWVPWWKCMTVHQLKIPVLHYLVLSACHLLLELNFPANSSNLNAWLSSRCSSALKPWT